MSNNTRQATGIGRNFDAGRVFDFSSPVRLHFGRGLLDRAGELCGPCRKAVLVTGRSSAAKSGLVERIRKAMAPVPVEVFGGVEPNPSIETVERGAALAAKTGADTVIGLGGGSALDAAKVIAVLAANEARFADLLGKQSYAKPPLRIVAIPTTCGTGSEANRYAIITDLAQNDKLNFASEQTYPAVGILDPVVLDGIPRDILVATALDAFTHAFEGFTSTKAQPFSDALAREAMRLIVDGLPSAAEGDAESKATLLYAAAVAGIVIDHTGTTMLHALGYYLTLRHGVPHGEANALLLPVLFAHLERACPDRMAEAYSLFSADCRDIDGLRRYLKRLGVDTGRAGTLLGREGRKALATYAAGKKNTAATRGNIDAAMLLRLLEEHAG